MNDDNLRRPGSPFENDEVLAFVVVPKGTVIDWGTAAVSYPVLWVPERLFEALAEVTILTSVDQYADTRLDASTCEALARQLDHVLAGPLTDMAREGTTRILALIRQVAVGKGLELVVEGP